MRWAFVVVLAGCSFEHGAVTAMDGTPQDSRADTGGSGGGSGSGSGNGSGSGATSSLRQKTITIQPAIQGTHTDFPLWISMTDPDLAARALADGSDIHFLANNMKLSFEIQRFTKATGHLEAWVKVPSLAAGTTILLRYGDATAAHAADPAGTFSGYLAVWHLEDTLANTTIADARNARNGTAVALTTTDSVTGQLGRGINFSDGTDQITFANPITGSGSHTISAWVNQRATTTNDCIIELGNGAQNDARWFHSRFNTATIAVGFYNNDYTTANENIIGGGWVHLAWVYDGATRVTRLYRNGAAVGAPYTHSGGIDTTGTGGVIGNAPTEFGTNMGINATLDEVRITNVTRSPQWLAAEALNQSDPTASYTVSAEQTP